MALDGPQLAYAHAPARIGSADAEAHAADVLMTALELARRIERLLEEARSTASSGPAGSEARVHSTRMAGAMAASLVDELEALVRPRRLTGSS
jgi:hypothetical protein